MEQSFHVVRKPARRSLIVAPATVVQNDFNALDRATKEDQEGNEVNQVTGI